VHTGFSEEHAVSSFRIEVCLLKNKFCYAGKLQGGQLFKTQEEGGKDSFLYN
jgi:hypothetical protein